MTVRHLLLVPLIILVAWVGLAFVTVRQGEVDRKKDQLVLGTIGEPGLLNPILSQSVAASQIEDMVFNRLLSSDENFNVIPELARDYRVTQKSTAFFKNATQAQAARDALWAAKDKWQGLALADVKLDDAKLLLQFEDPKRKVVGGTGYENELFKIIDQKTLLEVCVITITHDPEIMLPGGKAADAAGVTKALQALADRIEGVSVHEIFPVGSSLLSVSVFGDSKAFLDAIPATLAGSNADGSSSQAGEVMEFLDEALLNEPTITFWLRDDVKWQDGESLTAEDAAFTYRAVIDPQYRSPRAGDYWPIKKTSVPDKYTFAVEYRTPYGDLVHTWQKTQILPSHILEGKTAQWWADNYNSNPVGSGPFKVDEWKRNESVSLAANPNYFEGPPSLSSIVFRVMPDPFVNQIAFESRGFDEYTIAPYQYDRYKAETDRFDVYSQWSLGYLYIGWNLKKPMFADLKVRVALAHAIDIDRIIKYVYFGRARQSTGTFPQEMWYASTKIKPFQYDPEKALAMLAECGWVDTDGDGILDKDGKPFEFTLITNHGNTPRKLTSILIQDDLKKIGVKVNTAFYEWAVFIKNYLNTREYDACLLAWALYHNYDLHGIWHSSQAEPPGMNNACYANPKVDKLLEKVRTCFRRDEIKEYCSEIQEQIYQDQPYLFLVEAKGSSALYKDLFVVRRPGPDGTWLVEPIRETKAGFEMYMKWWAPQSIAPHMKP